MLIPSTCLIRRPILIPKSFHIYALSLYAYEPWALMMRLTALSRYSDRIVIGYSDVSFLGDPLPALSFDPFEEEIALFGDQLIVYFISLANLTRCKAMFPNKKDPMARDKYAHSALLDSLLDPTHKITVNPLDIIFVSDCDEIPSQKTMQRLSSVCKPGKPTYVNFVSMIYNIRWIREPVWSAPYFIRYKNINGKQFSDMRNYGKPGKLTGLHITWAFPKIEQIQFKLKSFAHPELNVFPLNTSEYIFGRMICGLDLYDRDIKPYDLEGKLEPYIPTLYDDRFSFLTQIFSDDEAILSMNATLVKTEFAFYPEVIQEYDARHQALQQLKIAT